MRQRLFYLFVASTLALAIGCGDDPPPEQPGGTTSDVGTEVGGGLDTSFDASAPDTSSEDISEDTTEDVADDTSADTAVDTGGDDAAGDLADDGGSDAPPVCTGPGAAGCACYSDFTCDQGLLCDEGMGICGDCADGQPDCPCRVSGDECDGAYTCTDGLCVCPEGGEGCGCRDDVDDACDDLLTCVDEVCACVPGTDGCPCAEDEEGAFVVCEAPFTCVEEYCECLLGTQGCSCAPGDLCFGEFTCVGTTCIGNSCVDALGTEGCPCELGGCDGALVCDGDTCLESCDTAGCTYPELCDDVTDACRLPVDCEEGGCAPHQLCDISITTIDCLEDCERGFDYNGDLEACEAIVMCSADEISMCSDDNRECLIVEGSPECGLCFVDYEENELGVCVEKVVGCEPACEDPMTCVTEPMPHCECPEGFVSDGMGGCEREACDPFEAGLACVPCNNCYDYGMARPRDGVVGVEPDLYLSFCVCRVEQGYFQDPTGDVRPCDADDDGWVTDVARDYYGPGASDNPLVANAQCDVRTVDRFVLASDDARVDILSEEPETACQADGRCVVTVQELVAAYPGTPSAAYETDDGTYLALFEPDDTDSPNDFDNRYASNELRRYHTNIPGAGQFLAAEVNPLTKACNHQDDDLNQDGVPDVDQAQESRFEPAGGAGTEWMEVFYHMAYFLELDRGYYRAPGIDESHGAYVVVEKSRAIDATDGLGLESGFAYSGDEGDYWRECERSRASDYPGPNAGATSDPLNFDFARWRVCENGDASTDPGTCQYDDTADTGADTCDACTADQICRRDRCEPRHGRHPYVGYDGREPATASWTAVSVDQGWPGMNHPSQFRCVSLLAMGETPTPGNLASLSIDAVRQRQADLQLANEGEWTLSSCELTFDLDGIRDSDAALGGGLNPLDPKMDCEVIQTDTEVATAQQTAAGRYQWVLARYDDYEATTDAGTGYTRGCINESVEWSFLCNGYDHNPIYDASLGLGVPGNFGRLICGCGYGWGGSGCEIGCPEGQVHYGASDVYDDDPDAACLNGFCLSYPADADAEANPDAFQGGRRGTWICGNFTASSYETEDATWGPALVGDDMGTSVVVRGRVQIGATDRAEMTGTTIGDGLTITVR